MGKTGITPGNAECGMRNEKQNDRTAEQQKAATEKTERLEVEKNRTTENSIFRKTLHELSCRPVGKS
jgi:hypothetical protein